MSVETGMISVSGHQDQLMREGFPGMTIAASFSNYPLNSRQKAYAGVAEHAKSYMRTCCYTFMTNRSGEKQNFSRDLQALGEQVFPATAHIIDLREKVVKNANRT